MEEYHSWEANRSSPNQEIPCTCNGIPNVIIALTAARHLSLFGAWRIQSMPWYHFLKIQFTIILSSVPRSSKWSHVFPPKPYMHLSFHTCHSPAHLILDFNIRIFGEQYRSESFSACSLLHSLVASFLLGSLIVLSSFCSVSAHYVSKFRLFIPTKCT